MASCPHCGEEVGFIRYFTSDHLSGSCVQRSVSEMLDGIPPKKGGEEE